MTTTMMSRHCTLEWYLARPANPLSTRSAELTSCQLNNRPAISLTSENTKGGEPRFNTRFDGATSPDPLLRVGAHANLGGGVSWWTSVNSRIAIRLWVEIVHRSLFLYIWMVLSITSFWISMDGSSRTVYLFF